MGINDTPEFEKMRFPWKILRTKGLWTVISFVGLFSLFSNLASFAGPYDFDQTLARYQAVQGASNQAPIKQAGLQQAGASTRALSRALAVPTTTRNPHHVGSHVAFLKVHKAASSTAQNIFLRFGWQRNLTFVLAPAKNPSGYPNIISLRESLTDKNILPPPPGKHYDILCNHVFYTNEAFTKFMPKDTAFIGIVRQPFEHYKSILNYFRPRYIFNKIKEPNPGSVFLRDPKKYEPKGRASASWTNNRMAVEFGFPEEAFVGYNKTIIDTYIKKLAGEFKLVLVAEHMEESILIMRRLLNWQTKDILFLDQNVARKKNESMLAKAYDRDFYREYAKIDYDLYSFFYKRLMEQIRHEGSDFDDELLAFQELRKKTKEFCNEVQAVRPLKIEQTPWGEAFDIYKSDCADMRRGEIDFITRIRIRQYGSKDI